LLHAGGVVGRVAALILRARRQLVVSSLPLLRSGRPHGVVDTTVVAAEPDAHVELKTRQALLLASLVDLSIAVVVLAVTAGLVGLVVGIGPVRTLAARPLALLAELFDATADPFLLGTRATEVLVGLAVAVVVFTVADFVGAGRPLVIAVVAILGGNRSVAVAIDGDALAPLALVAGVAVALGIALAVDATDSVSAAVVVPTGTRLLDARAVLSDPAGLAITLGPESVAATRAVGTTVDAGTGVGRSRVVRSVSSIPFGSAGIGVVRRAGIAPTPLAGRHVALGGWIVRGVWRVRIRRRGIRAGGKGPDISTPRLAAPSATPGRDPRDGPRIVVRGDRTLCASCESDGDPEERNDEKCGGASKMRRDVRNMSIQSIETHGPVGRDGAFDPAGVGHARTYRLRM
jgi:hypothetical protein